MHEQRWYNVAWCSVGQQVTVTDSNNVAVCLFLPARPGGELHSDREAGRGWRGVPGKYGLLLAATLRLVTSSHVELYFTKPSKLTTTYTLV